MSAHALLYIHLVVGDETRHGVAHDFPHRGTIVMRHMQENLAIHASHRPHEAHRVFLIVVLAKIALEEARNLVCHQIAHIVHVEVLGKEERVLTQVAVGQWP